MTRMKVCLVVAQWNGTHRGVAMVGAGQSGPLVKFCVPPENIHW